MTGTAYDTRTKLTWQQNIDAATYTDAATTSYCSDLKLAGGGWRVPTRAELLTLVDPTRYSPAIDTTAFPNTPSTEFWSASRFVGSFTTPPDDEVNRAWTVDFNHGYASSEGVSHAYHVRCVR
jgi:hypothetical protein